MAPVEKAEQLEKCWWRFEGNAECGKGTVPLPHSGNGVLGLAVKDEFVDHSLQRHATDGVVGLLRAVGAMGCDDAAWVGDQGLVGFGFVGKHVKCGAADAARATAGDALV